MAKKAKTIVRVVIYEAEYDRKKQPRGGTRMIKGTCHTITTHGAPSGWVAGVVRRRLEAARKVAVVPKR